MCAEVRHDRLADTVRETEAGLLGDVPATDVRGHDEDRVTAIHGAALRVGQATVIQDLEQDVEDFGVRLLDLVQEDDGVRMATEGLGELAAFFVADVAGRRADETRDRVLLHILGHIDADHRLLAVEEFGRERLGELGLADAGGAEEEERADGATRILDAGARTLHGFGDDAHGLVLTHDAGLEIIGQAEDLLALAFEELAHGHAGPAGDDFGDLFGRDGLAEETGGGLRRALELGDVLLELGDGAVTELGDFLQLAGALGLGHVGLGVFELSTGRSDLGHGLLVGDPAGAESGLLLAGGAEFLAEHGEPGLGGFVLLVLQSGFLDLELEHAAIEGVEFLGHAVDLGADLGASLVDEVDGLVRQEARGDVTVGKRGRLDERGVFDAHAVVDLEALLEAAQDRDRIGHAGRIDQDLLEAAFERGILLHVLAELLQSRGTDAVQLTARQHGLEEIGRVHRAVGLTGPDERVHLVDEEQDAAFGGLNFVEHGLEALFELTAILRAGDERAHVQREERLVAQAFGDVAVDDALGETLDDGGLADAGFADEHGIVLGAAGKDADDAADLFVAADDGIHLARAGASGEVLSVLGEGFVSGLRIGRSHALRTAHGLERGEDRLTVETDRGERRTKRGRLGEREQHVLGRHEIVLHRLGLVLGLEQ